VLARAVTTQTIFVLEVVLKQHAYVGLDEIPELLLP
jgi:hypothetical protein